MAWNRVAAITTPTNKIFEKLWRNADVIFYPNLGR
jgi:hypothetical protein